MAFVRYVSNLSIPATQRTIRLDQYKKAPAEAGAQIAKVRVLLPPLCQQEVNRKGPERSKTPNDLSGEYVRTTNSTPQIEISANSHDRLETAAKKKPRRWAGRGYEGSYHSASDRFYGQMLNIFLTLQRKSPAERPG